MRFIRTSSLEEYASWYLDREAVKGDGHPKPTEPKLQIEAMCSLHGGKVRPWFDESVRWKIVEIDVATDLANVLFLENEWTKNAGLIIPDGPNYRILRRVAANAVAECYLSKLSPDQKLRTYYEKLRENTLQLTGQNRIVLCSAERSEVTCNPAANFYLLDGAGRSLAFMILALEGNKMPQTVEALVAERGVREL